MPADRPTRFAADLLEAAAAAGRRESRSAKQQLDHWARVGKAICDQESAARRRIEAVLAGQREWAVLSDAERAVANAELSARIQASASSQSIAGQLNAEGVTTVSLDDAGNLVERRPDGSTRVLETLAATD